VLKRFSPPCSISEARTGKRTVPIVLLLLLTASRCFGWGAAGHNLSNNLAVDCLPSGLKPLFEANRAWVAHHSVDPDLWRQQNFAAESPRHFIDLDAGGEEAARTYPSDYWVAAGMMGRAVVDRNGTVPWRIAEYYGKLVRAYRSRNARAIVEIATWLGHYVADVHVPFHATANYDGQATRQRGIHARFETSLVEQRIKAEDLRPAEAVAIKDCTAAAFRWARASLSLCPELLEADRRAIQRDADFGYNYYTEFAVTARPIAIRRLEASAHETASLWMSAWLEAGSPPVPAPADVHAGEPIDAHTHDPDVITAAPPKPQ
jgi:hypothetical protein